MTKAASTMPSPDREVINERYDTLMFSGRHTEFSGGWANFGYWDENTRTQREAGEALMERLVALVPDRTGTALDVACGLGATTRHLARYFAPEKLTGINISEKQLASCRTRVPDARFLLMDAADMTFEDASFDALFCVEAAFHFDTREDFFREALRVLKPGGHLVLTDIIMTREGLRRPVCTEKNHLESPGEYEDLLQRVGFTDVVVEDVTEQCWRRHYRYLMAYAHEKLLHGEIGVEELQTCLAPTYGRATYMRYYLLASARKPSGPDAG